MKSVEAKVTKSLPHRSKVPTCDNSGAKVVRVISVKGAKTVKGRFPTAKLGDLVLVSVIKGTPAMRKQVVSAIIVRQKQPYRRPDGTHVCFESNACIILKDDKGTPKGTIFKGPIAKEAAVRWPKISKVASIVL
ncbi:MAG: 50S ribosomal protein L14 [Nanoarchaeota archaeon]|nr:50S ribosomal protein L14 [Nanoarchaeota archaeon]